MENSWLFVTGFQVESTDTISKVAPSEEFIARIKGHYKSYLRKFFQEKIKNISFLISLFSQLGHEINNSLQITSLQMFKLKKENHFQAI